MIGYVTIGINDLDKSVAFYDAAMAEIGYKRTFKDGGWAGYGLDGKEEGLMVYLATPFDKNAASFGNGSMLAFKAPSRAAVEAFHRAGLAHGGRDEGAPGVRGEGTPPFYGAYVRDPVGNKLCAYFKG
ncbi:MAG: VOC family protein [Alphaproteobacteria bacterium]|nr:VOC family protein [Alphaproteobacteria bacterium]